MYNPFDELPGEILEKILSFLPRGKETRFRDLRLVSRRLDHIVSAEIFHKISFSAFRSLTVDAKRGIAEMESICKHVNILRLSTGVPADRVKIDPGPWLKLVELFIPKLANLTCLEWWHVLVDCDYGPRGVQRTIELFGSLPNLRELTLRLCAYPPVELVQSKPDEDFEFPLDPICNLQKLALTWDLERRPPPILLQQISALIARSPDLEDFRFIIPFAFHRHENYGPQVKLGEIFGGTSSMVTPLRLRSLETRAVVVDGGDFRRHLQHFHHLDRLRIRHDPSSSAARNIGEVFETLSSEHIYLRNVHIDAINDARVFDYLSSFSGIQELSLKPGDPLDDSPALIERFFQKVLPTQSASLKFLRLGGNIRTQWSRSIRMEDLSRITDCQYLGHIFCWVWVTHDEVQSTDSTVLDRWLETAMQLRNLKRFSCPPVTLKETQFESQFDFGEWLPGQAAHDSEVQHFVEKVVFEFKWKWQAKAPFRIDSRRR
ncbi:hypothetical protein NP233_g4031 [Leucocoprinus birnbaumii]|uniref:F-box domain-containing protein n=1 Tax=Leucocoprinus birnbaumii TaxID=56174 RepID=A0AAD5VW65_9AGAR|nr:hypothetical protein NP233_g4031 [Leucocoprinus birnbaumii]